jgi:hypothetical protein
VEGAKAEHIGAGTPEIHVLANHILYGIASHHFIDKRSRKCHNLPLLS